MQRLEGCRCRLRGCVIAWCPVALLSGSAEASTPKGIQQLKTVRKELSRIQRRSLGKVSAELQKRRQREASRTHDETRPARHSVLEHWHMQADLQDGSSSLTASYAFHVRLKRPVFWTRSNQHHEQSSNCGAKPDLTWGPFYLQPTGLHPYLPGMAQQNGRSLTVAGRS